MKTFEYATLALAALSAAGVSALTIAPRSASPPRVVSLKTHRRDVNPVYHDRSRRKSKRAGTVEETLDNEETLYFANVTMGTPGQSLRLHIDTGSSDLWTNAASSSLCQENSNECGASGTYDSSSSSTYRFLNSDFNISYVDGSGASGDYATDVLSIGGQTLSAFQFGIGLESTSPQGVLGIGYASNEIQVNRLNQQPYPNLPKAMVEANLIQSNAYSLWLNDLDANEGQILFGGVDTAKYTGSLETVPVIQEYGSYYEFIIALTDLSLDGTSYSGSSSLPAPVLLDSGSSLIYLPNDLATSVFNSVNAVYDSNAGTAFVPCALAGNSSSLSFSFSGATINVPYNELVLNDGTQSFSDGTPACIFGVAPAQGSTPVLGDTFLRSAYVVYDLANNEISLAQTNFNSTSDNISEIGTGTASVPDATAVASPVTTVIAGTGGARLGGPASATGTVVGNIASVPTQVPIALGAVGIVAGFMAAL